MKQRTQANDKNELLNRNFTTDDGPFEVFGGEFIWERSWGCRREALGFVGKQIVHCDGKRNRVVSLADSARLFARMETASADVMANGSMDPYAFPKWLKLVAKHLK